MFEKNTRLRVRNLLEREFGDFRKLQQTINGTLVTKSLRPRLKERTARPSTPATRSSDERNMTRKTRTRQLRVHSAFQPGYCALCNVPYNSLEDHIQLKRHLKLIGDDANFISLKGFDDRDSTLSSLLTLDGIDAIEVSKNFEYSTRNKMPRTRTALMCDRVKDSHMSPVGGDSGHHLRSRKNINYMTPPLEEDSLTEKPEVVKEFRELRSSSRLLAKLTDHINDEVWNSGRPKRSCNRTRISADERLVVDNKSYYKVELLPTKLRSGVTPFHHVVRRFGTPNDDKEDDKGLIVKFRKRNSELTRLNDEAENFLFPKKDESSTEDDDTEDASDPATNSLSNDSFNKKVKIEDDESMHSTCSESRGKKRRRTHAEAFIMDNQKYYKFETPGSRLRYQGSYLSPVNWKSKNNGDYKREKDVDLEDDDGFKLNLDEYNFSFECVPREEAWYQTFQRKDKGEENYAYLNDDNYWNPLILPYQLEYLQPLDPKTCISQYNLIKKCLMEPPSTSTSVGCSTPDPNASNSSSSLEPPCNHDEDSKISSTMTEVSSTSTTEELKPVRSPRRTGRPTRSTILAKSNTGGKNPRKSPRQHASTLAILSSLIQQRKRKSARRSAETPKPLPTIVEEPPTPVKVSKQQPKTDYFSIARNIDETLSCEEGLDDFVCSADGVDFKSKVDIVDLLNVYDCDRLKDTKSSIKNFFRAKPSRKPGRKKKKNLTGWPNRNRRRREHHKDEDDSTVDSLNADSEENETCEAPPTDSIKKKDVKSVNNNKKEPSDDIGDCDYNDDRVGKLDCVNDSAVLTNKVNNRGVSLQYQPYVRVQKLDKNRLDNKGVGQRRSTSPKRTNRGQRRMPASPKSPRMLRRPRGRWYRER